MKFMMHAHGTDTSTVSSTALSRELLEEKNRLLGTHL